MGQDLTLKIAAQNEALAELEKTRAQVVALMEQIQRGGAKLQPVMNRATEGVSAVRRGLEGLAMQATGVEGPLGRIATGLLMFGTGGVATLSALAGIAAVGLAWQHLNKDIDEHMKALDSLRHSYEQTARSLQGHGAEMRRVSEEANAARQATVNNMTSWVQAAPSLRTFIELWALWRTETVGAEQDADNMALHMADLAMANNRAAEAAKRHREEQARLREELEKGESRKLATQVRAAAEAGKGPGVEHGLAPLRMTTVVPGIPFAMRPMGPQHVKPEGYPDWIPRGDDVPLPVQQDWRGIAAAAASGIGSLRGGLAGAFSAGGGVLSAIKGINPLYGTLASFTSGLLGLFQGSGGIRVTIARLEEQAKADMREVQGLPQNVSVVIASQTSGRATKYALDYQTGLDTASRMPY